MSSCEAGLEKFIFQAFTEWLSSVRCKSKTPFEPNVSPSCSDHYISLFFQQMHQIFFLHSCFLLPTSHSFLNLVRLLFPRLVFWNELRSPVTSSGQFLVLILRVSRLSNFSCALLWNIFFSFFPRTTHVVFLCSLPHQATATAFPLLVPLHVTFVLF